MAPLRPHPRRALRQAAIWLLAGSTIAGSLLSAPPRTLGAPPAKADAMGARCVVVSLPGLRLADLEDRALPTLHALAAQGAAALMNTVTAAPFRTTRVETEPLASAYLTLGLARRAAAPPVPDPGRASRALPAEYWRAIYDLNGTARPPLASREASSPHALRIALIAAADAHGGAEALLALTAQGAPLGAGSAGSEWLRRDPWAPYGVAADVEKMARAAASLAPRVDLLWLDPGDLQRAERYAPWCLPAAAARQRREALSRADRLLRRLQQQGVLAARQVAILAPAPAGGERFGLTPFIWLSPSAGPALARSGSTHLAGLVANVDLAPHLVASLGAAAASPLSLAPSAAPLATLARIESRSRRADRLRARTMPFFKAWLLLGLAIAFPATGRHGRRAALARLVGPLGVPIAAIALGALVSGEVWPWIALAAAAWAVARGRPAARPAVVGAALVLTLLLDPFLGAGILRESPLGYSLALGARYFGIGNEWMGYLLAAALLVGQPGDRRQLGDGETGRKVRVSQFISPSPRLPLSPVSSPLVAFWPALALIALAHPAWGANFGGALTAAVAVATLFAAQRGSRGRRRALVVGAGLVLLVIVGAWFDSLRPPGLQTHLGRLVHALAAGGPAPLFQIAAGKLATNLRIAAGYWGLLLAAETAGCLWLLRGRATRGAECGVRSAKPEGASASHFALRASHASAARPLWVLLLTALAALLCNDSGVIAAALMLSFAPLFVASAAREDSPSGPTTCG